MSQFLLLFGATTLYYLLSEWVLEELQFARLRDVKSPTWWIRWPTFSQLEFGIRVLVVILLGLSVAPPTVWLDALGLDRVCWGLFAMAAIYECFLLWDLIVLVGGARDLATALFFGDLAGGFLTLVYLWLHDQPEWASPVAMVFFVIVIFQVLSATRPLRIRGRMRRVALR